jgi:hypothetical protein
MDRLLLLYVFREPDGHPTGAVKWDANAPWQTRRLNVRTPVQANDASWPDSGKARTLSAACRYMCFGKFKVKRTELQIAQS